LPLSDGDASGGGTVVLGGSPCLGAGLGKMRFCAGGGGTMITGYGLDMNWPFAGAFAATTNPRPAAKAKIFDAMFGSPRRPFAVPAIEPPGPRIVEKIMRKGVAADIFARFG